MAGWKKTSSKDDFDKKYETFLKRWTPGTSVFNVKRNYTRASPLVWFFLLSFALILIGAISSYLRIFLFIGLFILFVFVIYFVVFILMNR